MIHVARYRAIFVSLLPPSLSPSPPSSSSSSSSSVAASSLSSPSASISANTTSNNSNGGRRRNNINNNTNNNKRTRLGAYINSLRGERRNQHNNNSNNNNNINNNINTNVHATNDIEEDYDYYYKSSNVNEIIEAKEYVSGPFERIVDYLTSQINDFDLDNISTMKNSELLSIEIKRDNSHLRLSSSSSSSLPSVMSSSLPILMNENSICFPYGNNYSIHHLPLMFCFKIHLSSRSEAGRVQSSTIFLNAPFGTFQDLISVMAAIPNLKGIHLQESDYVPSGTLRILAKYLAQQQNLKVTIQSKSIAEMMSTVVATSKTLKSLHLATMIAEYSKDQKDILLHDLAKGFQTNKSIQEIVFYKLHCQCFHDYMAPILHSLIGHATLKRIDIAGMKHNFDCEALIAVYELLSSPKCKLESFDTSSNYPDSTMLPDLDLVFARALKNNCSLTNLNLWGTTRNSRVLCNEHVLKACASMSTLTSLNIAANEFTKTYTDAFAQLIRTSTTLKDIKASDIYLIGSTPQENNWKDVFAAIASNTTLEAITFRNLKQNLSCDDIHILSEALTVNTTLEQLELPKCGLNDDCIVLLGNNLPKMKGLRRLNISSNGFGIAGAQSLLHGMKHNYKLESIDMKQGLYSLARTMTMFHQSRADSAYSPFEVEYQQISYYLSLNPYRGLLCHDTMLPCTLWPLVLQRANNNIDAIYHLLRQEVSLHYNNISG